MKKKGFTLVELLAVIVILAVIALIATPTVLNMIEISRKGAAESSLLSYVDEVENQILVKMMKSTDDTNYDGKYQVIGKELRKTDAILTLELKGDEVDEQVNNEITVKEGEVTEAYLKFGAYYVTYYIEEKKSVYCTSKINYLAKCDGEEVKKFTYTEKILNGADPVIEGNLQPINIDEKGKVTKANINEEWYKYEEKKWANAVILKDKTKTYKEDEEIPLENIESYFVWVPRYRYKIFNTGDYDGITEVDNTINKTIEIVFEDKNTTPQKGTKVGEYLTHPAFTNLDVNGMWVGKFETTGTISDITVRPGETSLRSLNIKTMFNLSYNYDRNLDSHMMKNTEWGAVTYLTYSKYGKNGKVRINNNSSFLTGYAAVNEPTCGYTGTNETCNNYGTDASITMAYNTETGYLASTTGNITGIYDMAGGAHEYMAAYMSGKLGTSGFTQEEINSMRKYFDIYNETSTVTSYEYRILGDATGELGPFGQLKSTGSSGTKTADINSFFSGLSGFVDSSYPWFYRGGDRRDGVLASPSYFHRYTGGVNTNASFRLVL